MSHPVLTDAGVLDALEADLRGGHLVIITGGDAPHTFSGFCDPRPADDGSWCWIGPDRATIVEAVEDGRRHHPGYEPRVEV